MVGLWLGPQFALNLSARPLVKGNGSSRQFVDDLRLEGFHWVVILLRMLLAGELSDCFPVYSTSSAPLKDSDQYHAPPRARL